MKVRLIHLRSIAYIWSCAKFQFHEGSINTVYDYAIPEFDKIFQFHEGSINTLYIAKFVFSVFISIP